MEREMCYGRVQREGEWVNGWRGVDRRGEVYMRRRM
jgi:hypothetical protein